MLFPYKYVPHSMEKMQEYIDYIFYELWCKAPDRNYDIMLFEGNNELAEIINDFYCSSTQGGITFISKIEKIYEIFKTLSNDEIDRLKKWYGANNDIEKLCSKDPSCLPVRYNELEKVNISLSNELKELFVKLYGTTIISLKAVRSKIGTIEEHYDSFMRANNRGKCPFCGFHDIKGVYHSKRDAYDHYLAKNTYPFNSINFKNLAPMCAECNSSYKLVKDPIRDYSDNRRKAFYPYADITTQITIKLTFNNNIETLTPHDIEIEMHAVGHEEEVETWKDLFGIEERYKAKCASESGGKYWYRQIIDECHNYGKTPEEFLRIKKNEAEKNPLSDTNFLRKPFLEACEEKGLFKNE